MSHEVGDQGPPDTSAVRSGIDTLRERSAVRDPVDGHVHGDDHVALRYDDRDEQLAIVAAFLQTGLGRGERWEIAVVGDGVGPGPTDRTSGAFQRLHHEDEYSGTSIGLVLCREIVDRHGSELRVESEPGEGSTFAATSPERRDP